MLFASSPTRPWLSPRCCLGLVRGTVDLLCCELCQICRAPVAGHTTPGLVHAVGLGVGGSPYGEGRFCWPAWCRVVDAGVLPVVVWSVPCLDLTRRGAGRGCSGWCWAVRWVWLHLVVFSAWYWPAWCRVVPLAVSPSVYQFAAACFRGDWQFLSVQMAAVEVAWSLRGGSHGWMGSLPLSCSQPWRALFRRVGELHGSADGGHGCGVLPSGSVVARGVAASSTLACGRHW